MRRLVLALILCGAVWGSGCKEARKQRIGGATSEASRTVATKPEDKPVAGRAYGKDMRDKGCEMLPPELVAETLGVAVGELRQHARMGCIYSWEGESEELQAHVMMIRAHESVDHATRWFADATRSQTAEEAAEAMKKLREGTISRDELDTDQKKGTANALIDQIGAKPVTFEDVDAGDEARVNDDGSVHVRVRNLTFVVAAYKGSKQPQMTMPKALTPKAMAAESRRQTEDWGNKTRAQRKEQGSRLAKAVAAGL